MKAVNYHGASPIEITEPHAEQKASVVESLFSTSSMHTASQSLFETLFAARFDCMAAVLYAQASEPFSLWNRVISPGVYWQAHLSAKPSLGLPVWYDL